MTEQLFQTFDKYNNLVRERDAAIAAGQRVPKRIKNYKVVPRGIMSQANAKCWLKANWLSKKLKENALRSNNPNSLENMREWGLQLEPKELKAYVGFYCARIFPWTKVIQNHQTLKLGTTVKMENAAGGSSSANKRAATEEADTTGSSAKKRLCFDEDGGASSSQGAGPSPGAFLTPPSGSSAPPNTGVAVPAVKTALDNLAEQVKEDSKYMREQTALQSQKMDSVFELMKQLIGKI